MTQILTKKKIASLFKPRLNTSHKGDHGHALLIAGHAGKMGASVIASRACLRAGVGLLTAMVPMDERLILQTAVPEAMILFCGDKHLDFDPYTAVGIGPGWGIDKENMKLIGSLLKECTKPLILDADALNLLSQHPKWLRKLPADTILTPHPKEFDRMFGVHTTEEERIKTAAQKAKELQIIIVLKGHQTHILHQAQVFKNTTGNAGLAKGGSGDALTGIILSFLAQGYTPIAAAQLGVYLHGAAADGTLRIQSPESMLITDVIENLGAAFKSI